MKQKSFIKIISCLALIIFSCSFKYANAQSDVTAIDVLPDPDQSMSDAAKSYNDIEALPLSIHKALRNLPPHCSYRFPFKTEICKKNLFCFTVKNYDDPQGSCRFAQKNG